MDRDERIEFLLNGPSYVGFNTLIHILEKNRNDDEVVSCREKMIKNPLVEDILNDCLSWPGPVLKRHNDAKLLLHKISFLADIGLNRHDETMDRVAELIMSDQSGEGPFRILTHLYERFGGSGENEMAWFLCDAPIVVRALAEMGYARDKRVLKARDYLISLADNNGWRCHASDELGRFRGPGGKDLECPYSTLLMLGLISEYPELMNGEEAQNGLEVILELWSDRKKRKPFLFGMGTDFKKLKSPAIWYDILHVTDVLSRYEKARNDERLHEMMEIIYSKADGNGLYTPESVWMAWKGWDFAQKKLPSPWITFKVLSIQKRMKSH
jgi:hypothetical protein